jgi:hypothetical protein
MATKYDIGEIGLLLKKTFSDKSGLRQLLQTLLNIGMREEAGVHVGADKHERSSDRLGYRNGTKPREVLLGGLRHVRVIWSWRFRRFGDVSRIIRVFLLGMNAANVRFWWRVVRCIFRASARVTCKRC